MIPMPAPVASMTQPNNVQKPASVDKIRSVFPETWLWSNSSVGYDTKEKRFRIVN
jgi:hypothetical protein